MAIIDHGHDRETRNAIQECLAPRECNFHKTQKLIFLTTQHSLRPQLAIREIPLDSFSAFLTSPARTHLTLAHGVSNQIQILPPASQKEDLFENQPWTTNMDDKHPTPNVCDICDEFVSSKRSCISQCRSTVTMMACHWQASKEILTTESHSSF